MKKFDFGLSQEEEMRAAALHDKAIVIDMLFQGPMSPYAVPKAIEDQLVAEAKEKFDDDLAIIGYAEERFIDMAISGDLPQFKGEWYDSGITGGNRQLGLGSLEDVFTSICRVQRQFDAFDWLIKARSADDFARAKAENKKVGIVTCQETMGIEKDLNRLESLYKFGLRSVQLTYNNQNFVASGCGEDNKHGVSVYGQKFIAKLNELGIVVDTGHCNKQTTLDACKYSSTPVIASHTGVESVYSHMRCKSDEELVAIANTGGVVGIFNMPWFIYEKPAETSLEHFLDHIDYTVKLIGVDHVGIGTDWPMSDILPSLILFKEKVAHKLGFKKGDGPSTEVVEGLATYGEFSNITRGLVSRGYDDEAILKILGGNWVRVFREVWK